MKTAALIALSCALLLSPAQAGTIGVDPTSGQNGLTSGFGGLTLGWEFQVTATDGIVVDGLGFWDYQSDGFLFGQTFDVGLWDPATGTLLRESVITSASTLKPSLDQDGSWRVNPVAPLHLAPGLYRIGALMPVSGANQIVGAPATFQSAPDVTLVRFLRQLGSATLAMPDVGPPYSGAVWFGPTFTYTTGAAPPPGAVVAPGVYAAAQGSGGLNTLVRSVGAPRSYQMQFSTAALAGLPVGARLTQLQFRLSASAVAAFPSNTVTWSDYQVTLAQAAGPVSTMSANFASNMSSPVLVRHGPLSLSPNTFMTNATLNPFAPLLVFDTPYVYQGGDLVMLFRHPGSDSATTAFLDAVTSATPGYATDFRAFSTNSFTAPSGFPASVTIAQIAFTYSPIGSLSRDGTNVVVVGMGGPPGGSYHIVTSTDIAAPVSLWAPMASNRFDASGNFRYTNSAGTAVPAQFFRIALP